MSPADTTLRMTKNERTLTEEDYRFWVAQSHWWAELAAAAFIGWPFDIYAPAYAMERAAEAGRAAGERYAAAMGAYDQAEEHALELRLGMLLPPG